MVPAESPALAGRFFTTELPGELIKYMFIYKICISSVQSLGRVQLFVTPWTTACQASLSIANSQSLLKLMSIELVMPSNHLIFCRPLLLPPSIFLSIRVFSNSQFFESGDQSIGISASASVLPMNTQDWFLLRTDWLNLLAVQRALKSLLQHHSSSISSLHTHTCKTICMMGRFSGWCQIGLWYQDSLSQAKFNPNLSSHQNLRHLQTLPTTWYLHTFGRSTLHLLVCLFSEQFSVESLSYYKITLPTFHWILNWQIKTKTEKWCNTKTVTGQLYQ